MQLMADQQAAQIFEQMLCDPHAEGEPSTLAEMHDLGALVALIPEFGPCTGRVQHDLYHVYTVDRHSLYVVAMIRAWLRGEQDKQQPMPVAVAVAREVRQPYSLLLAALLHDVAKPLGHGHAARGARMAAGVAARLGLSWEQQQEVRTLVGQHLLMAHLSQRRDLSDPSVISGLAEVVGSVGMLRRLYLLTAADTAMTAPGNLTDWKARLLDELYMQTYFHLQRGGSGMWQHRAEEVQDRRDALELALRKQRGAGAAVLAERLPDSMLLAHATEDLLHHLEPVLAAQDQGGGEVRLTTRDAGPHSTELTVCCPDSTGLLADITGVLAAHNVEVLGAQVYTLDVAGGADREALALDIFTVRSTAREAPWTALTTDLERVRRGELEVDQLVARFTGPSGLPPRVVPHVSIEVSINNEVSGRFSVIEVQAPDRLGLLHAITRTLSRAGLVIHLSRVATEAGRVVDIFYVSDAASGGKVTDAREQARIREAVVTAISELEHNTGKQP